ncbi:ceramide synthase component Lag1/Lac1 [Kipferlia bialata]|uniref:Ceramide synthase component Lag1/Lac1 n=1 Tax=Kipferlia bialata TaxID=797122 RepID=A0A9K3GFS7_9EUKA|nr:ceramide synthase component Lag1/Lac1 [Kipferlia bialata]|eukprot:g1891.t1
MQPNPFPFDVSGFSLKDAAARPLTDFLPLVVSVPVFAGVRKAITKAIYKVALRHGYRDDISRKLGDSMFYFLQYTTLFFLGFVQACRDGVYLDRLEFVRHMPDAPPWRPMYQVLAMAQLTQYIVSFLMILIDSRRNYKDFAAMCIHHTVVLVILVPAYRSGHYLWTEFICSVSDFSDIWLELSKVVNYTVGEPLSAVTFSIFTVSFLGLRLVYLQWHLVPLWTMIAEFLPYQGWGPERDMWPPLYAVVFALNVWWSCLIVKMIFGIFKGEIRGDIRDDAEAAAGFCADNKVTNRSASLLQSYQGHTPIMACGSEAEVGIVIDRANVMAKETKTKTE